jgi:hypothetical protein
MEAERAATAGDLASADELLKSAARIQEAELGPLHPDLANTLNNLAIVAERTGRPGDAEAFYRRAVAIVSAALPPDDPMVAASRQNLEDFCRAQGLPIAGTAVISSGTGDAEIVRDEMARDPAPTPSVARDAAAIPPTTRDTAATPPGPSRSLTAVAIGVVILVTAALLLKRPWSSRESPTSAAPAATQARESAPARPAAPPPLEQARPIEEARPLIEPARPPRAAGEVSLATVQLCKTLSTNRGTWRCDSASDRVAPGALVLYTRVRSPRNAAVVHRWYHGDTLRQSVELAVRASPREGYRTYSRQTVDAGGDWRVEVRSLAGELLHEQRFAVR